MGVRRIEGTLERETTCGHDGRAVFVVSQTDPAVMGGFITGGKVRLSGCMTHKNDYYLIFRIGGKSAGETVRITDQNENEHTLTADFDMPYVGDEAGESDTLLKGDGDITLIVHDNGNGSGNVQTLPAGCTITLEIQHNVDVLAKPPSISQGDDGTLAVSWEPATVYGVAGEVTYSVSAGSQIPLTETGTERSLLINIPDNAYGTTIPFSVTAVCCGVSGRSSSRYYKILNTEISAPEVLTINGAEEYEGAEATLQWRGSSIRYRPGEIVYQILFGTTQVAETTETYYIVPESVTQNYTTTGITVKGVCNGIVSRASNRVSYTYNSGHQYIKIFQNGGWTLCVPRIFHRGGWVECVVHYYANGEPTECASER